MSYVVMSTHWIGDPNVAAVVGVISSIDKFEEFAKAHYFIDDEVHLLPIETNHIEEVITKMGLVIAYNGNIIQYIRAQLINQEIDPEYEEHEYFDIYVLVEIEDFI